LKKKRIAFFFFETRDINTYPSIINAIRVLAERGYTIDCYLTESMQTSLRLPNAKFIVVSKQDPYLYAKNSLAYMRLNGLSYDFIFAFSFEALAIASLLNRKSKKEIPTVYFSMELFYRGYIYKLLKRIRVRNIWSSLFWIRAWILLQIIGRKFIKFSIVQDKNRGAALREEFGFIDKIFYVPNSYLGFCDDSSNFARERFKIPADKKIILYTGGFERGNDLGLLDISKKLDSQYVLFLNAYSRDHYLDEMLPSYQQEIENGKLFVNQINLSEEDYDMLVRSSFIGLAWYPPPDTNDPNMYYLGLSSGKLTKFLSCGVPVITQASFYQYPKLIDENNLGRTCVEAREIPQKIEEIAKVYDSIRKNAKKLYLQDFEYKTKFAGVLDEMMKYV
jgi:hypothetical protein